MPDSLPDCGAAPRRLPVLDSRYEPQQKSCRGQDEGRHYCDAHQCDLTSALYAQCSEVKASVNDALLGCILTPRPRLGFDLRVRGLEQRGERRAVDFGARPELHVTHVLSGSLE